LILPPGGVAICELVHIRANVFGRLLAKADLNVRSCEVSKWPILLQKLAAMDLAAGPFVEPRFEALALTHFTQL